ncbi:MAG: hypothetical protein HYX78_01900 [Armatimonadetes bacterium]|nr:hypothetical protein [Armatimonadota bacterium]
MDTALEEKVARLRAEILGMRRGVHKGRMKPHKPLLLLAVIELLDRREISENRIRFDERLKNTFSRLFALVQQEGDWCHPSEPFFHLRTSGFWYHKPLRGKERACSELDTSGGGSAGILENIDYVFLDPDSYSLMMYSDIRRDLSQFILSEFFEIRERESLAPMLSVFGAADVQDILGVR